MPSRAVIIRTHRWLSLLAGLVWGIQALSGCLLLFHRDLLDAGFSATHHETDAAKIGAALDRLVASGAMIRTVATTAGAADRYSIDLRDRQGSSQEIVIDGAGTPLRATYDQSLPRAAFGAVEAAHTELYAGDAGKLVLGASGALLLTNIGFGLALAGRVSLRHALWPQVGGMSRARLFQWHRATGLWGMLPATMVVLTGSCMALAPRIESVLSIRGVAAPVAAPNRQSVISFPMAVGVAQRRYPGASLVSVRFPTRETGVWRVRLRQHNEWFRAFGRTTVYVDAASGAILADIDPARQSPGRRFLDNLYPVHTGEVAGMLGRGAVLCVGIWLLTMLFLGLALWTSRRRRTQ